MARSKTLKITKKHIPIPPPHGHKLGLYSKTLGMMKKGQSVVFKTLPEMRQCLGAAHYHGIAVTSRHVDEGYRVWRR